MKVEDFEKLKEKIETVKAKKARAEGALEQAMARLKSEFGCNTIEEAQIKLTKLQKDIDKDEDELAAILDNIEKAVDWNSL